MNTTTIIILSSLSLGLASCSRQESTATEEPAGRTAAASDATPYPLDVCLVSGEKLGSMGEPHVIVHQGREIKFCCDHCEPKFREDPEKYLSQLDQD